MTDLTPGAPTILVVFGATGDLMERKIEPSLYHLHEKKGLPERFRIVGGGLDQECFGMVGCERPLHEERMQQIQRCRFFIFLLAGDTCYLVGHNGRGRRQVLGLGLAYD